MSVPVDLPLYNAYYCSHTVLKPLGNQYISSFIFIAEYYLSVLINYNLPSFVEGHFYCVHFLTVASKIAVNVHVQISKIFLNIHSFMLA